MPGILARASAWVVVRGVMMAGSGVPTVQYGTPNGQFAGSVTALVQNAAATLREIVGATALLCIVIAALLWHFIHDQRATERAKELVAAAVIGLLVVAFAPQIVNMVIQL